MDKTANFFFTTNSIEGYDLRIKTEYHLKMIINSK